MPVPVDTNNKRPGDGLPPPKGTDPSGNSDRVHNSSDLYNLLAPIFGTHWQMARAIALAESEGNPRARNVNTDGSVDRGLFQINNKYHPEVSDTCAYNVFCNAHAAWRISNHGTDWSPWATYNDGSYKAHLSNKIENADSGFLGTGIGSPVGDGIHGLGLGGFLSKLGVIFTGGFWLRILMGVGGLALVLLGVVMSVRGVAIGTAAKMLRPSFK